MADSDIEIRDAERLRETCRQIQDTLEVATLIINQVGAECGEFEGDPDPILQEIAQWGDREMETAHEMNAKFNYINAMMESLIYRLMERRDQLVDDVNGLGH